MTETAAPSSPAPASAPAAAPPKTDSRDELLRQLVEAMKQGQVVQEQLLKEHTAAINSNTRALERMMNRLGDAIEGLPPSPENPEGVEGLTDMIEDLRDVANPLGEAVTATNITLARYAFVFDTLVDINTGDPEAQALEAGKEPLAGVVYKEGRVPTLADLVAALRRFDAEAEAEAKKQEEEDAKAKAESDKKLSLVPPAPSKPPMMGNTKPAAKPLPPMPVMRPLPK